MYRCDTLTVVDRGNQIRLDAWALVRAMPGHQDRRLLDDISLAIEPGQFVRQTAPFLCCYYPKSSSLAYSSIWIVSPANSPGSWSAVGQSVPTVLVNINAMVPPTKLPDGSTMPLSFEKTAVYDPTWHNLTLNWGMLCLHATVYLVITFWVQKQKDIFK